MSQPLKYGLVGISGCTINICIYYLFSQFFGFGLNLCSVLAFLFAVTSNYIFNSSWTFLSKNHRGDLTIKDWGSYVAGNIQGLLINLFVLNLLIHIIDFHNHILAQLAGIFFGMVFNYYFAKKFVFK
jgi:dolichol-phosphate mannosyltransferase